MSCTKFPQYGRNRYRGSWRSVKGYYCEPCATWYDDTVTGKPYWSYGRYFWQDSKQWRQDTLKTCLECGMALQVCALKKSPSKAKPFPFLKVYIDSETFWLPRGTLDKYIKELKGIVYSVKRHNGTIDITHAKGSAKFIHIGNDDRALTRALQDIEEYQPLQLTVVIGNKPVRS